MGIYLCCQLDWCTQGYFLEFLWTRTAKRNLCRRLSLEGSEWVDHHATFSLQQYQERLNNCGCVNEPISQLVILTLKLDFQLLDIRIEEPVWTLHSVTNAFLPSDWVGPTHFWQQPCKGTLPDRPASPSPLPSAGVDTLVLKSHLPFKGQSLELNLSYQENKQVLEFNCIREWLSLLFNFLPQRAKYLKCFSPNRSCTYFSFQKFCLLLWPTVGWNSSFLLWSSHSTPRGSLALGHTPIHTSSSDHFWKLMAIDSGRDLYDVIWPIKTSWYAFTLYLASV